MRAVEGISPGDRVRYAPGFLDRLHTSRMEGVASRRGICLDVWESPDMVAVRWDDGGTTRGPAEHFTTANGGQDG